MTTPDEKPIISEATSAKTDANKASIGVPATETVEEIKTNPFILDCSVGYGTSNDPASKPWQPYIEGNIGYMGCLKKDELKSKAPNVNLFANLNVNAGLKVQEAKVTYLGFAGAKENSKGQVFGGGCGLTMTGTHRNDPFVDYDKSVHAVQEGDKEFAETGKHCAKLYKSDVNNKWSVGAGIDAFTFQKLRDFEFKETVSFEYRENSGFCQDAKIPYTGRGNETPEEYVMNRVPEGVNVVKNLSPFNTKIECSAEWKPVKNFRNLSFGAKAGVHLNGRTPYPIAGVYAKIGL